MSEFNQAVARADMRTLQRPQVVHAVTSAIECVLPTLVSDAMFVVTSNSTASSSNLADNFKARQKVPESSKSSTNNRLRKNSPNPLCTSVPAPMYIGPICTLFVPFAVFIYYFNCMSFAIRLSGRKIAIKVID